MTSIYAWSTTPSDNGSSDVDINFAEGQAPSTVNNSARQLMARVAELLGDVGGAVVAGGTANAITVTANSSFTTYANGRIVAFRASADNTGAVTLNVNAIGSKSIRKVTATGDAALEGGEIQSGCVHLVIYNSALDSGAGGWQLMALPEPAPRTDYVPTGTVLPFAGTTAPTDYLLCYGQAVSRTTYAGLFAVIGTTYGAGDGSTTFNLPDLRGRVIAGQDDMGGTSANRLTNQSGGVDGDTLGATGGAETHTLTEAQMPSHTHGSGTLATGSAGSHSHTLADNAWAGTKNDGGGSPGSINVGTAATQSTNSAGAHTHTITGSTASAGSDAAHNNVQPTIILNYIIRT